MAEANEKVTFRIQLGERLSPPIEFCFYDPGTAPGSTEEQRRLVAAIRECAKRPASQIFAGGDGVRLIFDDGDFVYKELARDDWWRGRPAVSGAEAVQAALDFQAYRIREVVWPKVKQGLAAGAITLGRAFREFPDLITYVPEFQALLREAAMSGQELRRGRGERSMDFQESVLARWLLTYTRVEEFLAKGYSLWKACGAVADAEGRRGKDRADSVRKDYKCARRWLRWWTPAGRSR